jgi:hypothetical protein
MKTALVFAAGLFLIMSVLHRRERPAPARRGEGNIENELALVQIEQMRVISPEARVAAQFSRREEQLKYKLSGIRHSEDKEGGR